MKAILKVLTIVAILALCCVPGCTKYYGIVVDATTGLKSLKKPYFYSKYQIPEIEQYKKIYN